MIPQYNHNMATSMVLWLDNLLCDHGQAYVNETGLFYRQYDPSTRGNIWATPYKSLVFDSCTSGANILSGVYTSSGQFLTRESGLVIDFLGGRVISPHNWGNTLSGVYARKEVNVYFSTEEETNFWLEHIYKEDANISYANTGVKPTRFAAPCIILTNSTSQSVGFALGGTKTTKNTLRAFTISDTNYLQEGINSLFADSVNHYVPLASYSDAPIGTSGDLKGGIYNYCTGIYNRYGCAAGLYIDNVVSYKMNEKSNKNVNYMLSITEFDVSKIRTPGVD